MKIRYLILVSIFLCSFVGHTWCGTSSSKRNKVSAAERAKRAEEAKAKKAAMLAEIEARKIALDETNKKATRETIYKDLIETQKYKDKVKDKENVVFLVFRKREVIPEKLTLQQMKKYNIWLVIVDDEVIFHPKLDETRQLTILSEKLQKE